MEPLTLDDIRSREDYEGMRPDFRRRLMGEKARRRVPVGEHCSVHFENRDTMLYQVHEMLRAENSWDRPNAAAEELEAYNPLIPGSGELTATVMFEWDDAAERAIELRRLVGIDEHLWIEIGDTPRVAAAFDPLGLDPTKVSAVHYVKWTLSPAQQDALSTDGTVVRVVIDHPAYPAQSVLSEQSRQALAADSA